MGYFFRFASLVKLPPLKAILSTVMNYETRRWSVTDSVDSQKAVAKPASHAKNDFEKDKYILRQLVTKDFKIKYRRSILGVAWSVLNPLLMMIVKIGRAHV